MLKYNGELLFGYSPSAKLLKESLLLQQEIGFLNVDMRGVFDNLKLLSNLFAYVEVKYSLKIEDVDVTLKEIFNRGRNIINSNVVTSLLDDLLEYHKPMTEDHLEDVAAQINEFVNDTTRYNKDFGIYRIINNERVKVYEPPLNKELRTTAFKRVINKSNNDKTLIDMLHTHIIFEMIHPFRDGNGRTGRLVMQNSFSKILRDIHVLPISYSMLKHKKAYFKSFNIKENKDIDKSLHLMIKIVSDLCKTIDMFLKEYRLYKKFSIDAFNSSKNKLAKLLMTEIRTSLQTSPSEISKRFKLNLKTVNSLYKELAPKIGLEYYKYGKEVFYWNKPLEEAILKVFVL